MDSSTRWAAGHRSAELALEHQGGGEALRWGDLVLDRAQLAQRCDDVTRALGSTRRLVLVPMRNDPAAVVAYLGARRGGHVVLLSGPEPHEELRRRWRPDVVLDGSGQQWWLDEQVDGSSHDLHPELGVLLSTSGTTGAPRSVRLSDRNLSSNAAAVAASLSLRPDDRALTTLPLHYCYGLSVLHSHLVAGAAVVLGDHSVVDPCCERAVREHGVTTISAVPHMLDLLDRSATDLLRAPSLRRVTVAGGRAAPEQVRRHAELGQRHGWDLYVMYGQTEATARMACLPPSVVLEHPDCIGGAVGGGVLDLVPAEGAEEGVGELVFRGDNVMMGYADGPEDLARGADLDELRTGDLALRRGDDLFEIVGRRARRAKVFGLRIDLDHLEQRLAEQGVPAWCIEHDGALAVAAEPGASVGDADTLRRRVADLAGLPPGAVRAVMVERLARTDRGKPDRSGLAGLVRDADTRRSDAPARPVGAGGATTERATSERIAELYADLLGVGPVRPEDTFVALGGDSLSYVEVSLRLEELLGHLPPQWHLTTVAELGRSHAVTPSRGAGRLRRRVAGWAQVETSLVLRAAAILAVVSSHAGLWRVRGGAHLLLAIAGFNFARFLVRSDRPTLRPDTVRSIARIAVPASLWLALVQLTVGGYHWAGVALVNSYLGPPQWTSSWRYWFVEALVLCLLVASLVTTLPWMRRLEARSAAWVPAGLLLVTLVFRFDVVTLGPTPEPLLAPHRVAWCFVLGWLVARATTTPWRWAATLATLVTVPGFFGEPTRDAVVVAGLLVLIWVPTVRIPRRCTAVLGLVAASSLYVYLTHFQVFMPIERAGLPAWVGVLASLLAGVVVWRLADPLVDRLVDRLTVRPAARPAARRVPS